MGLAIERREFGAEDHLRYGRRLQENLAALRRLLNEPDFGVGPQTMGAELELSMVDADGLALPCNRQVLADCDDRQTQVELNSFNLEYNFHPGDVAGTPFAHLENQIALAVESLDSFTRRYGGRVVSIGILPTLRRRDLTHEAVTDVPRFHALAAGLRRLKGRDFAIDIHGAESLQMACDTIAIEGANTSFQLHLRVAPRDFAATFNAAQLVTPLVLALGANSPVFLERLLWDETRVALFKQSTDARALDSTSWRRAARVPFGHGWVRQGALELFEEAVALYPPILPVVDDERALETLDNGTLPALRELRLLQGTIWQWNRPVYDPDAGGHLRIELRALPAGPTPVDMAANSAFLLGLIFHFRERIDELLPAMPFRYAEYNFYRSAQQGLDAKLLWPTLNRPSPLERDVRDLVHAYLEPARKALVANGVDGAEADRLIGVIAQRNDSSVTGARWQRDAVTALGGDADRRAALRRMLAIYMDCQARGIPVGQWDKAA